MHFNFGLLAKLLAGIVGGIILGSLGSWFGFQDAVAYEGFIRLLSTFTSLFSTFFIIPHSFTYRFFRSCRHGRFR